MSHPDQQYIDALLNNDTVLLQQLYENHAGKIKAMVLKNNGTEDDAADLFQEALVDIFKKAKSSGFILTCPLDAYLYLICKNRWINELKKKGGRVTFTDTTGYVHTEDVLKQADILQNQNERGILLQQKLNDLGEGCRNLLELAWSGLGLEEVAKKLNNSYGYVRKKKSECMAKLITLVKASPAFATLKW